MIKCLEFIFWFSILAIAYTYFLYPLLIYILAIFINRPVKKENILPKVSVIIAAYNEQSGIGQKIKDTLQLDYPKDKLEVMVASDCSKDRTDEIAGNFKNRGVVLVRQNKRLGKTAVQNKAARQAWGEILVFTDATTKLNKDVIRKLVRNFADPKVGCVGAALKYINSHKTQLGKTRRDYWEYEKAIRRKESSLNSLVGVSGCCYAVRKEIYKAVEPHLISDFVITWLVLEQGYRSVFEPEAEVYEDVVETEQEEISMRARVTSSSLVALMYLGRFFNPFKYGFFSFQLFSHKILRYCVPIFLIAIFVSNIFLLHIEIYRLIIFIQLCIAFLTVNSLILKEKTTFYPLAYFFVGNFSVLKGIFESTKRGKKLEVWQPLRK